jgi:hypothetical protein
VAQVQVVIDNVAQNPSSAYTISGSTITFTSAPLSGTNNIYVYYTSPITQVIAPGQGTVTNTALDVYGSSGTGAENLPSGTTAQRPGTPVAGATRYNSTIGAVEYYNGSSWIVVGTPVAGYNVQILTVGGGGGGGGGGPTPDYNGNGGGGGGGVSFQQNVSVVGGVAYTVTVGAGGTGTPGGGAVASGGNGGNSSFGSLTFTYGGGGGADGGSNSHVAGAGGSGGGGGGSGGNNFLAGVNLIPLQGYPGGLTTSGNGGGSPNYPASGGGGAGQAGFPAVSNTTGGNGGYGLPCNIATGSYPATYYSGGGGGGTDRGGTVGTGGLGGGGNAGASGGGNGTAGTTNTGGGGGGASNQLSGANGYAGGNGGSGIVIVAYQSSSQKGAGGTVTNYTLNGLTYYVHTFLTSSTYTA